MTSAPSSASRASRRSPTPRPRSASAGGLARRDGLGRQPGRDLVERRYEFYRPPHHRSSRPCGGRSRASRPMRGSTRSTRRCGAIEPYERDGLTLRIHLSHWYPWGTMIYGRFVIPDAGPNGIELHDRIWEDGIKAILGAGGVINDHHGVGLKLAPYMRAQARARHAAANQGGARPNRIMNPGKLDLDEKETHAQGGDAQLDEARADRRDDQAAGPKRLRRDRDLRRAGALRHEGSPLPPRTTDSSAGARSR